jgi:hypothetical protein
MDGKFDALESTYATKTVMDASFNGLANIYATTGALGNKQNTISNINNITIGTLNTPGSNNAGTFKVTGGAYFSHAIYVGTTVTATSFNANSDYRLKENIEKLVDCSVDNLNPVSYILKKNKDPHIGFLAHELQEYFPTAVSGQKDGETMQTVNYMELIPVLVKEIQNLKKEIKCLKNDVEYLKGL